MKRGDCAYKEALMSEAYVKRVNNQTNTKIWVNNPTIEEAANALEFDVVGGTTNPTYCKRLLTMPDTEKQMCEVIDQVIVKEKDDHVAAEKVQMAMVAKIAKVFLPVYEQTNGSRGLTAIQGNPYHDNDADYMIAEALRYFEISPNIIVKIPGTCAGLTALRHLTAMNKNHIITSCLSVSQEEAYFKVYKEVHDKDGKSPKLFVTTLAGIFDEFTKQYCLQHGIELSEAAAKEAGNNFSKRAYEMWTEGGYKGFLQGGGARNITHFTELMGGSVHSTLNYSFIKELNELDLPLTQRIDQFSDKAVVEELEAKLPYYKQAYQRGALSSEEFDSYPPFVFFHNGFITAWDILVNKIAQRRALV